MYISDLNFQELGLVAGIHFETSLIDAHAGGVGVMEVCHIWILKLKVIMAYQKNFLLA